MSRLSKFLCLLGLMLMAACTETRIEVESAVAGRLEGVRWRPIEGDAVYTVAESLSPGGLSTPLLLNPEDEDAAGHLDFDLVVDGQRVALQVVSVFEPEPGRTLRIRLEPGTPAVSRNLYPVSDRE